MVDVHDAIAQPMCAHLNHTVGIRINGNLEFLNFFFKIRVWTLKIGGLSFLQILLINFTNCKYIFLIKSLHKTFLCIVRYFLLDCARESQDQWFSYKEIIHFCVNGKNCCCLHFASKLLITPRKLLRVILLGVIVLLKFKVVFKW